MAAPRITPSVPAAHRRIIRTATATATAVAGVAVLIAAGGYVATTTFGPDAYAPQPAPATDDPATATDQVLRGLRPESARRQPIAA